MDSLKKDEKSVSPGVSKIIESPAERSPTIIDSPSTPKFVDSPTENSSPAKRPEKGSKITVQKWTQAEIEKEFSNRGWIMGKPAYTKRPRYLVEPIVAIVLSFATGGLLFYVPHFVRFLQNNPIVWHTFMSVVRRVSKRSIVIQVCFN